MAGDWPRHGWRLVIWSRKPEQRVLGPLVSTHFVVDCCFSVVFPLSPMLRDIVWQAQVRPAVRPMLEVRIERL